MCYSTGVDNISWANCRLPRTKVHHFFFEKSESRTLASSSQFLVYELMLTNYHQTWTLFIWRRALGPPLLPADKLSLQLSLLSRWAGGVVRNLVLELWCLFSLVWYMMFQLGVLCSLLSRSIENVDIQVHRRWSRGKYGRDDQLGRLKVSRPGHLIRCCRWWSHFNEPS